MCIRDSQYGDSDEVDSWHRFELIRKHPELKDVLTQSFIHDNYDNPPAGLDSINWRAFFGLLYKFGFDGYCYIEPHSPSWTGEQGDWGVKYPICPLYTSISSAKTRPRQLRMI